MVMNIMWQRAQGRIVAAVYALLVAGAPLNCMLAKESGSINSGYLNLDLTSPTVSITVGEKALGGAASQAINVGGSEKVVNVGDVVTAAEFVAVREAVTSGAQNLNLDAAGCAIGGTFSLANLGKTPLGNLVVPSGVTAIGQAGRQALKIDGLLSADGALVGLLAGGKNRFNIRAGDVSVGVGGTITTIAPANLASLVKEISKPVDLNIFSQKDILNAGAITASGVLSLAALGRIINRLPGGAFPGTAAPVMHGMLGTNLFSGSGSFTNAGSIFSSLGNVTFNTAIASNLVLNNVGGTIAAMEGLLRFRQPSFTAKELTEIVGGNLSAKAVDIWGGKGPVDLKVDEVAGVVNVEAGDAHLYSDGGTLTIGEMNLRGDPFFVNTSGNVHLTSNLVFTTNQLSPADHDLLILAKGEITADPSVTLIDVSSSTFRAGDVHIVAGFNATPNTGGQINNNPEPFGSVFAITGGGGSTQGGDIILPNVQIRAVSTSITPGTRGGNVTIVAREGDVNTGKIEIGGINTSSARFGGGKITIWGGSSSDVHVCGPLDTRGLTSGGDVDIRGANPKVGSGNPQFDNGTLVAGGFAVDDPNLAPSVTIGDRILRNGSILTSSAAGFGGDVFITAEGGIEIAGLFINTSGAAGGGSVTLDTELNSNIGPVIVRGFITTSSSQGQGGAVNITGNDPNDFDNGRGVDVLGNITTTGLNGGGNVNITSSTGSINVGFNASDLSPLSLTRSGGIIASSTNNFGGSVTLTAPNGSVRVALGINTSSVNAGGVIIDAGDIVRIDGTIDAHGTSGAGNVVNIQTTGGDELFGIETGTIITNGAANAGQIVLSSAGTIVVKGGKKSGISAIGLNGSTGGPVTFISKHNIDVLGAISANGGIGASVDLKSTSGLVNIAGPINTSGTIGAGGEVQIDALTGIVVGGKKSGITTTGKPGGAVVMDSGDGRIDIAGTINTSGVNATSVLPLGGYGGNVTLNNGTGSFVNVTGSIITRGGSALVVGSQDGGNAGTVTIRTLAVSTNRVGGIFIGGAIDARGGSAVNTGENGGDGGAVILEAATVQVNGTVKSTFAASIDASGGTGPAGNGNDPAITIKTFGIQPVPTNFDLTSTTPTEFALPGAVFEVGNPLVNGTRGAVASGNKVILTGTRVVSLFNPVVSDDDVSVTTTGDEQDITQVDPPLTVTYYALMDPNDASSPRRLVTASQALALFQKSRGETQTLGVRGDGTINYLPVMGSAPNFIDIGGFEFGKPLTAFNLKTAVPGEPHQIRLGISLTDDHPHVRLQLGSKVKSGFSVSGDLFFDFTSTSGTPAYKLARIELGSSPLVVQAGSSQSGIIRGDPEVTLDFVAQGKAGIWTNHGTIRSGVVLMRNSAQKPSGLTLNMGNGAAIEGGGANPRFRIQLGLATEFGGTLRIQNNPLLGTTTSAINNMKIDMYAGSIFMGTSITTVPITAIGPGFTGTSTLRQVRSITSTSISVPGTLKTASGGSIATGTTLNLFAQSDLTFKETFVGARTSATLRSGNAIIFDDDNFVRGGTTLMVSAGSSIGALTSGSDFRAELGQITFTSLLDINLDAPVGVGEHTWRSGTSTIITATDPSAIVRVQGTGSAGTAARDCRFPDKEELTPLSKTFVKLLGSFQILGPTVFIGDQSEFSCLGADVIVRGTTGNVGLGDESTYIANAGNVSILAAGNVIGGLSTSDLGNTFFARGMVGAKTGGGVEVLSGTTNSLIVGAIASRPTPPVTTMGPNLSGDVVVEPILPGGDVKGRIEVGTALGDVSVTGTTTIKTFNGVVLINGMTLPTGVQLNDASVTSIIPIGYAREQSPVNQDNIVDTGEVDDGYDPDTVDYFVEANLR